MPTATNCNTVALGGILLFVRAIRDEDYSSYKAVSMFIAFPFCSFKCCRDANRSVSMCQNAPVATLPLISVSADEIFRRYQHNRITHSVVCGGLEPIDSIGELVSLLSVFRHENHCDDTFVIYTGYTEQEISSEILVLSSFPNVIMKFGRYIPSQLSHFDPLLGVNLASPNQYAKKIS